jgi:hypothetical protein
MQVSGGDGHGTMLANRYDRIENRLSAAAEPLTNRPGFPIVRRMTGHIVNCGICREIIG